MNKKILYSLIGVPVLVLIVLCVIGSNMPAVPKQASNTPATQSVPPVAQTPENLKDRVATILSASVDHYAQLLVQGKTILGTTQYNSAAQGTSALHDPNSPASKFSAFRNSNCVSSDPGANAMDAYHQASDVSSSAVLDSWSEHANNAASDLCLWAQDAVDWETMKISSTQLHSDEQKITTDLTQARKDIQSLPK